MNEETLFQNAVGLPPGERAAYLDRACGGDATLRERVDVLLRAHDNSRGFLGTPVFDPAVTADRPTVDGGRSERPGAPAREAAGDRLGPYKLLQQLGEGGMGTVWAAEQTEPVRRRVAVKVIKPGMDSNQVLARFEAERQALALMDHPNIARVLDAATTDQGRPYFVMELIKGVPITTYCDQAQLTPRERLELFVPVCQAVQHAHQKGVIHRDLKPSNVLVALYDGKPVPKVIDFGIAKATAQKLTERTVFTEVGQIVGTLEYMAPEQAELNNLDIDTRADVYALGVILYELLSGSPPFTARQLRGAAFTEMLRMIREVEPPRPSTRLSSSEELPGIAARRNLEPRRLTRLVHGDLDWIVMKCLEKERGRRYETANALAQEIGRYLVDEPVLAGPPGTGYRLRKFLRRNKRPALAAAALILALVGGIVGTTFGLIRAESQREAAVAARKAENKQRLEAVAQRDKALAAERLAADRLVLAEAEKARAEKEAAIARAVGDFLQKDLLLQADPGKQADAVRQLGGKFEVQQNPTIRELLDRAVVGLTPEKIEARFPGQKEVQASVLRTVGQSYEGVGEFSKAIELLLRAGKIDREVLGTDDPKALSNLAGLARVYLLDKKVPEAIGLFERIRDTFVRTHGPDHPYTLNALNELAPAYQAAGDLPEAVRLLERVRAAEARTRGRDDPENLGTLSNLASAYANAGRHSEAIRLFERVRDAEVKTLGPDHPQTLTTRSNLAAAYMVTGKVTEAIRLFEQIRDVQVKTLGPDHPDTLGTLDNLAMVYMFAGRPQEARPLYEQIRDIRVRKEGPDHPDTLSTLGGLAIAYAATGRPSEGIRLLEQVHDAEVRALGPDHLTTLGTRSDLARAYRDTGKLPEAIRLFEQLRVAYVKVFGPEHTSTLTTFANLARAYQLAGELEKAQPLYLQAVKGFEARKYEYPAAGAVVEKYAELLEQMNRYDQAEVWRRKWLAVAKERAGDDPSAYARALAPLGQNLLKQAKWTEAEVILREDLARREANHSGPVDDRVIPGDEPLHYTMSLLGGSLLAQKKYAEAEPLLREGYQGLLRDKAKTPQAAVRLAEAGERLARLYDESGRKGEAVVLRKTLAEENAAGKPAKP